MQVMTPNPECAGLDTTLVDALHTMHDGKFLHLPVTDRGKFILVLLFIDTPIYDIFVFLSCDLFLTNFHMFANIHFVNCHILKLTSCACHRLQMDILWPVWMFYSLHMVLWQL